MSLPIKIKLPENFLDEEMRDGYLVKKEMKEVWAVLLDLLAEFERVCKKHNIRWFADAGTILGAVRHKGMIPWDDDIDVMMLREEYDRFCQIAADEFQHPYFFQTEYTDPGCCRGHVQIRNSETTGMLVGERKAKLTFNQGIFLDVFPIEDLPLDISQIDEYASEISNLKGQAVFINGMTLNYHLPVRRNPIPILKSYCCHLLMVLRRKNYRIPYDTFEHMLVRYKGNNSPLIAKLVLPPFKPRRLWKREWLSSVVYLPFEFMEIPVPVGYIELLNTFYGNWHEFVIGASTHGGTFVDPHKSYKEYIK